MLFSTILPSQFTNIASDFSILISKAWSIQKALNLLSRVYRPATEHEIRTTSSAKASKNNYSAAISNTNLFAMLIFC
jgi:hypothetical protein